MTLSETEQMEYIFKSLELKIKRHIKQTVLDERDDLEQELKIKILEKLPNLMEEDVPGFIEFALKLETTCA